MSQKIQNIWNVGCRPEWTSLSGSPLDFALPLYKCVKLTRLLIQSTHQSWMRHHHDSGFSLAGTQKMSHCRISHQTGHQPHSRATLKPRGQIHQAMGDLKHQLGDCALPLQNQQKKGARKCIHHLITFLVLLFEYCCSCAQGGDTPKGSRKHFKISASNLPLASQDEVWKRTETSKDDKQKITHSRLPSCASCEPEVMVWHFHCHSQPGTPGRRTALYWMALEGVLKVWPSASSSVLCPTAGAAGGTEGQSSRFPQDSS